MADFARFPDVAKVNPQDDRTTALIRAALRTNARSATFACGGSLPINTLGLEEPFQIRFGDSGKGFTLKIPNDPDGSSSEFQELLRASQPATFGLGGKDVLDENYRKAGKLDRNSFVTDFCPYAKGIVDTIAQMLAPQMGLSRCARSVRAELYKLNVYSAPGGMFKPHVDTPRDVSQLGSLVVLLPIKHEGGQLIVRHGGKECVFGGTEQELGPHRPTIKWAAFYSDCEHEVLKVTSGHRVTLTYNLFLTRGVGHLAGKSRALDKKTLPLYKTLQKALRSPDWFPKGHVMAIWCSHSYAHTSGNNSFLPESLKGADMAVYETVKALGLKVQVLPVVRNGGKCEDKYGNERGYDLANTEFTPVCTADVGEDCSDMQARNPWGTCMKRGEYFCVNKKAVLGETQLAYMVYGNQSELDVKYSHAAMLIRVPPFAERGLSVDKDSNILRTIRANGESEDEEGDEYYGQKSDPDSDDYGDYY